MPNLFSPRFIRLGAAVLFLAAACKHNKTTTEPTGDFSISAAPTAVSVQAGSEGSVTISLSRTSPFDNAVALSLIGMPAGVTGQLSTTTIPVGSSTATLNLVVAATVVPGNYSLTIRGSGGGLTDETTVTLTVTAAPTGSFALSVTPAGVSVPQAEGKAAAVTVSRTAPFAGAVALAVEGAPGGLAATLDPATVAAGATGSTISVAAAATVTPGVYPLTIRGTATGVAEQTVVLTVTVTANPGSLTLALAPTALSIEQNDHKTTAVTITRTAPFAGAVSLALEGLPAGVTGAFAPATIPAGSTAATLTVTVAAGAAVGVYPLTVRATAAGLPDQTAPLALTVTATSNVTLVFCDLNVVPVWMGYRDGDGPWTQVNGAGGNFTLRISSDRVAVAFVRKYLVAGADHYSVALGYFSRDEVVDLSAKVCGRTSPIKTLTGTVAGLHPNDFFSVGIGEGYADLLPGAGTAFTIGDASDGVRDLVAATTRTLVAQQPDRVIIRRGTNYPAGGVIPVLDFAGAEAFTANVNTATITGLGGSNFVFYNTFVTANGTAGTLPILYPTPATAPFMTIPADKTQAGDLYNLRVVAQAVADGPRRTVLKSFTTATNQTLDLGPQLNEPTVFTLTAAPFYQVRLVTTLQPEYPKIFVGTYLQPDRNGSVFISTGWLRGGTAIDLTTPDVTQIPGWQAVFGPKPGVTTRMTAEAYGWTGGLTAEFPLFNAVVLLQPGITVRTASLSKVAVP